MYLLDTNIVSELRKAKPHGAVLSWVHTLSSKQVFLSAVTIGELQQGIEKTRKHDPVKAKEIEAWLEEVAGAFEILPMDANCFREYARFIHGKTDNFIEDAMIAATARVNRLIVATRNVRDFQHLGVETFNPFHYRS